MTFESNDSLLKPIIEALYGKSRENQQLKLFTAPKQEEEQQTKKKEK